MGICSTLHVVDRHRCSCDGDFDGGIGINTVACGGADDGSDVGEEIGAPVGPEPTGDLAICRDGPKFAFGSVVVGSVRIPVMMNGQSVRS